MRNSILLALPLTLFLVQIWSIAQIMPFRRQLTDPIYQYLLNGVAITTGIVPGHTDHPGTSTQWLNGFIQWLTYQVSSQSSSYVADVVARPEHYLQVDAVVIVSLQLIAFVFTSFRLKTFLGLRAALIFQAIALPTAGTFVFTFYPIPESTVWLCGMLFIGVLAPQAIDPRSSLHHVSLIALGLIIAIGATSKIIFFPALLTLLFWLRVRDLALTLLLAAASAFGIMWPIRSQYQRMWEWFTSTASTSARYPGEAETSSGLSALLRSPFELVSHFPSLLVLLILVGAASLLIALRPHYRGRLLLRVFGPTFTLLGLWGFTYKFWRPNDFMLLSSFTGLLAAVGFYSVFVDTNGFRDARVRRSATYVAALLVLIGVLGFLTAVPKTIVETARTTPYDAQIDYLVQNNYAGSTVATAYGTFTQASALFYGNASSNNVASIELLDQYPGWINFQIWNSMFYFPTDGGASLESCGALNEVIRSPGGLLLAPGRPVDLSIPTKQYESVSIALEAKFGQFEVYRVYDVKCPRP